VFVPLITELLSLAKEPLELSAGDDHEFDLSHKFARYVSMGFPQNLRGPHAPTREDKFGGRGASVINNKYTGTDVRMRCSAEQ